MKIQKNITALAILFSINILFFLPGQISAQLVCTGDACSSLDLTESDLNQIFYEMQTQVVKPLVDNYAKASAAANIMQPVIGNLGLTGFTFGINAKAGVHDAEPKDIYIPNVGRFEDVQIAGAQVIPSAFAGVNLGYLFGSSYDEHEDPERDKIPPMLSLTRFDLYGMGLSYTFNKDIEDEGQIIGRARYSSKTKGVQLRYRLSYGADWLGPMLRWHGLSLMAGMVESSTFIDYSDTRADQMDLAVDGSEKIIWSGDFVLAKLASDIKSYPLEIHTGFQFLYFIHLTIGGGVAIHSGKTRIFLAKYGTAFLESETYTQYLESLSTSTTSTSAILGLTLQDEGTPPRQMTYAKVGLEFDLYILKIGAQAMATDDKNYGGNVAIRFEF